ncbi:hypothetical protein C4F50_17640 [Flavobacterium sp. KB82]|uniref:Uncharacterized protein n=1 Tax=Flavobacterium hungaricum TaxID=2082725 RepID=A0ABR9TN39_9FLAO|nr:hypothetical protein [Flavobacterium hungaricum]
MKKNISCTFTQISGDFDRFYSKKIGVKKKDYPQFENKKAAKYAAFSCGKNCFELIDNYFFN